MTIAFYMVPPSYLQREASFASAQTQLASAYSDGRYSVAAEIEVGQLTGADAAEELFDMTNNPGRVSERAEKVGNRRRLSVGDIVKIGNEAWLCQSVGWIKITRDI